MAAKRERLESDTPDEEKVRAGEEVERMRRAQVSGSAPGVSAVQAQMLALSDGRVRARLAEVLSSAGLNADRVALEVLYMLPAEFVRGYTDLFHRALTTGEEGRGSRDDQKAELGKARGKGAKAGKKATRGAFFIRSEKALGEKERIDRALRKLARQMRDAGNAATGKETVLRCGEGVEQTEAGCGRWVENTWRYCPHCGKDQKVADVRKKK